jgi:hypothetical protein
MMSRLDRSTSRLVAGTIAALVLAACSDSANLPTADRQIAPTEPEQSVAEFNTTRHLFHTKEFYAKPGAAKPSSNTGIFYHGGTVITGTATKVVAIYWGNPVYTNLPSGTGVGTADGTLIGSFLRSLGGSPYFNINTTYYNGSGARVVNAVSYTGYWNTSGTYAAPSAAPTDQDMINLIRAGIGKYITYDPNTVYAIFTGRNVNLGGGFGSQYCAYHTRGTLADGRVFYYAAMPYNQQYPTGCTSGYTSPNADAAANSEVNTLAHVIEETTTDARGDAWFDRRGYENADKCAWTWGATSTLSNGGVYNMRLGDGNYYLIQRNWVNAGSGGCAVSY